MRRFIALLLVCTTAAIAQTTRPATAPSITPEARVVLDEMAQAYDGLQGLKLEGTTTTDIDVAGRQEKKDAAFSAAFAAPGQFRHETKDDMRIGSTGEKLYMYVPQMNQYQTFDIVAGRSPLGMARGVLQMKNPSLALAVASDARAEMLLDATNVERKQDTVVGGANCATLQIDHQRLPSVTLMVDSQNHFIRQARYDLTDFLKRQSAPNVKSATITVEYTTIDTQPQFAADQFAWTPPAGATPMQQGGQDASGQLAGKPAPAFKLQDLAGKDVSLADFKNQVVVLDFWATWCPPCVASLPHLQKLADEYTAKGVTVLAINARESKQKAEAFMKDKKLTLRVLLDSKGEAMNAYKVTGIPQTVVIDKSGNVAKVIVGFSEETGDKELRDAIDAAIK